MSHKAMLIPRDFKFTMLAQLPLALFPWLNGILIKFDVHFPKIVSLFASLNPLGFLKYLVTNKSRQSSHTQGLGNRSCKWQKKVTAQKPIDLLKAA